jgi:ABC-type dipeptide/oligopeptide/nickel transport system permease component
VSEYHLNDSIPVQYHWLTDAVRAVSSGPTIPGIPAATDIKNRIPITYELTLVAIGLAVSSSPRHPRKYKEGKGPD